MSRSGLLEGVPLLWQAAYVHRWDMGRFFRRAPGEADGDDRESRRTSGLDGARIGFTSRVAEGSGRAVGATAEVVVDSLVLEWRGGCCDC